MSRFENRSIRADLTKFNPSDLVIENIYEYIGLGLEADEDDSSATEMTEGDDPFANIDTDDTFDDDDSFDFGGDSDSSDSSSSNKPSGEVDNKETEVKRSEYIKAKYSVSSAVRRILPNNLLDIAKTARAAILTVETTPVSTDEDREIRANLRTNYVNITSVIEEYLINIDDETYDSIFVKYIEFWHILNDLKKSYDYINKVGDY